MMMKQLNLLVKIAEEILRLIQQRYVMAAPTRVLDNADLKQLLKIGDTKLYYLKKKKIFKAYNLDGKEIYLENEVMEALRGL